MGGWTRRGAVVLGASLLAVAFTGGQAVRGISYAVPPPEALRIAAPNPASLELGPTLRDTAQRRRPSGIAAHVKHERAMMTAAVLMILAEGTARNGAH